MLAKSFFRSLSNYIIPFSQLVYLERQFYSPASSSGTTLSTRYRLSILLFILKSIVLDSLYLGITKEETHISSSNFVLWLEMIGLVCGDQSAAGIYPILSIYQPIWYYN